MIIVTFEAEFEGDDPVHEVREAFAVMDTETRKEEGCLKYVSSIDVNNSSVLRIYEEWESMKALIPHFKTPHMATFQQALGGLKAKSMEAKVYEVSKELPFPN